MIPDKSEGSIKKGIWFIYNDGINTIQIWGSSLNGKEKIFLNNELFYEQRNLTKKSTYNFKDKNGISYEVNTEMPSLLKAVLEVQIIRDGDLIKTFKAELIKGKNITVIRFFIGIVSAVVFGLLQSRYHFPDWVFFVFLAVILIVHLITRDHGKIVIEE